MAAVVGRVLTVNKANSFTLLVMGLSRKEAAEVEKKLPDICGSVHSKTVTLVMPLEEDGKSPKVLLCMPLTTDMTISIHVQSSLLHTQLDMDRHRQQLP